MARTRFFGLLLLLSGFANSSADAAEDIFAKTRKEYEAYLRCNERAAPRAARDAASSTIIGLADGSGIFRPGLTPCLNDSSAVCWPLHGSDNGEPPLPSSRQPQEC